MNRHCGFCKQDQPARLAQYVNADKSVHVGFQCCACGNRVLDKRGRHWIPHDELIREGIEPDSLPVARNSCGERCAACGNRGAQNHHWAPKHLFGDEANLWPTDYLCKMCHDKWHRIVTPNMCDP